MGLEMRLRNCFNLAIQEDPDATAGIGVTTSGEYLKLQFEQTDAAQGGAFLQDVQESTGMKNVLEMLQARGSVCGVSCVVCVCVCV